MKEARKLIEVCGSCESPMAGLYCSIGCENLPAKVFDAIQERNIRIRGLERRNLLARELLSGRQIEVLAAENRSDWLD